MLHHRAALRPLLIAAAFAITTPNTSLAVASAPAVPSPGPSTYCNPLPIPNYPIGRDARNARLGDPAPGSPLWLLPQLEPFRELADPSVLWHEDRWYLYPSVDMAWVSDDDGASWTHHPLNVRDLGYAPTVVKHRDRFLLMGSGSAVHASASPLGPFVPLGKIVLPPDSGAPTQIDPMLFSDDDNRLYFYWGCTERGGIWAVELDATDPTRLLSAPSEVIPFRPDLHPWERLGERNQHPAAAWMEGAWMLKHAGRYYLTYAAAGTQNRTYAMGCYVGDSPLGPFRPQKNNPVLRTTSGLVTGTAHGCVVAGRDGALRVFYTLRAGVAHGFERRVGMDTAFIDASGELAMPGGVASSSPRLLPGRTPSGPAADPATWLPLNTGAQTLGSSSAPGQPGRLASDEDLRTWWQPAPDDASPSLTARLVTPGELRAVRIVWRDIGLDPKRGFNAGPFRYRVEAETAKNTWTTVLDRSENSVDLLSDYHELPPTRATRARLIVVGAPPGITPGVADFTVFGPPAPAISYR